MFAVLLALSTLVGCDRGGPSPTPADSAEPGACAHPQSLVLQDGSSSGFERCEDGVINRAEAVSFDPAPLAAPCAGDEPEYNCRSDADCTRSAHGACLHGESDWDGPYCACAYTCASDADCADDEACVPRELKDPPGVGPTCERAGCRSNADCPSGECGFRMWDSGCGVYIRLACRSGEDRCRVDEDCTTDEGHECVLTTPEGPFLCSSTQACTD